MSTAASRLRRAASALTASPGALPPGASLEPPPALVGGPYEEVQSDVGPLWVSTDDAVMRDHIRSTGTWEPEEGRLLDRLLFPGARFLDVGANIGYFSLFAARAHPGVTVDSVEPFPPTVALLRVNLWRGGVAARVWPVALDRARRTLSIRAAEHNVGDARVAEVGPGGDEIADIVVPAVPGDEIFAGRGFDVVKLDVQGWELEVLTGMAATLAASPTVKIVAEFWPAALRERGVDPRDRLRQYREALGFRLLVCRGDDLEDLDDASIVRRCDDAGPDGQVNLLLQR